MRFFITIFLLFGCVTSCVDASKVAPFVDNLGVVDNVLQLKYGRELYVTRCSKCHNALRITRYTKSQWTDMLPEMIFKSKFTNEQTQAVTAYIQAVLQSSSTITN